MPQRFRIAECLAPAPTGLYVIHDYPVSVTAECWRNADHRRARPSRPLAFVPEKTLQVDFYGSYGVVTSDFRHACEALSEFNRIGGAAQ